MRDYLRMVNRDDGANETVSGFDLQVGGRSHVVGYIGHDYFYDVDRDEGQSLRAENRGESSLPKGTFALACTSNVLVRPAITRSNVHILLLNRSLGFPGAWSALGLFEGLAAGKNARDLYRGAAKAFAAGQHIPEATALGSFAFGD